MRLTSAGERQEGPARIAARRAGFEASLQAALRRVEAHGRAARSEHARQARGVALEAATARRAAGEGETVTAEGGEGARPAAAHRGGEEPVAPPGAAEGPGVKGGSVAPGPPAARAEAIEPGLAAPSTPLAAAVRGVPPVIEAFQRSGAPALSLEFGCDLSIELRQGPGGVELRLATPAALTAAARAELAGLRTALAARGLTLARAEVRERTPRSDPGR